MKRESCAFRSAKVLSAALLAAVLIGCTGSTRIKTVADLADALQREGLDYATQKEAELPDLGPG